METIEGKQGFIDEALDNLNKEQVLSLLNNPEYWAWIVEELKEREAEKKAKAESD